MPEKLCLFAGTTEGRRLAALLAPAYELTVCVATEYGEILLEDINAIRVRAGRMDEEEMYRFFSEERFVRVVDATHPYAEAVTENIAAAALRAAVPVLRVLREQDRLVREAVCVSSPEEACAYLTGREGNVLLTTGSKELPAFAALDPARVWARVLPLQSSLEACRAAGIPAAHVIAAQGPFPRGMNEAQLRMIGARWLVTKSSGRSGGFEEKIEAALACGATPVVIGKPEQTPGVSLDEAIAALLGADAAGRRRVTVVGVGPGNPDLLTDRAKTALRECDLVLGAGSVIDSLRTDKPAVREFLPQKVRAALDAAPSVRNAAVVMRGDVSFYSGAKKLLGALDGYDVELIPGISSLALFASKLGESIDGAACVSLHGRDCNIVRTVCMNRRTFALTGGENTVSAICAKLCAYGLGALSVSVGERLSYPEERIVRGSAEDLSAQTFDPLSVLFVSNGEARAEVRHGIPDDEFIRGDTPMTKSEVRSVSLAKLALASDSVVYDVGAGTGSVSVECALAAYDGEVYAVEKDADAAGLIRQNQIRFRTDNLHVIEGRAPAALEDLPAPTHAFIGGSSGDLCEIIAALLRKNPDVRIVVNAVTLETQTEAQECARRFGFSEVETVSLTVARSRKLGRYHMMVGQNPVSVITLHGGGADV